MATPTKSSRVDKRRQLYKTSTPPWRETYRRRCFDRLRQSRESLLEKFRGEAASPGKGGDGGEHSPGSSMVRHVMAEEWRAFKRERNRFKRQNENLPDLLEDIEDIDEVLSIMDDIQADLVKEEQAILAEYEASINLEEASLCAAVDKLTTNDVICPLCRKNPLMLNKSVIFCSCGIRLNTEQDSITLGYIQEVLSNGVTQHNSQCLSQPLFSINDAYDLQNLIMSCKDCDFLYIVV
ncbi:RPA-interacting protein B-like [Amphiura filiformis]|uniref:RPA-interacting protein B-like n=1 Tax=Amphiura filiformis TaxID=82378 RepID=UPI003B220027